MGINNIVFDFGNVIRLYDVEAMLGRFSLSGNEKSIFREKIFDSPSWQDSDRGYGYRDVIFSSVVPTLSDELKAVFYALVARYDFETEFMPENKGISEIISELRENGYRLYLLSNIGLNFHLIRNKLPEFRFFDGFLTSCDYGILKPQKEIYEVFFRKFSLIPEECLFIDDSPANVLGSINCGMDAVCYNALNESADALRKKLSDKGINISF